MDNMIAPAPAPKYESSINQVPERLDEAAINFILRKGFKYNREGMVQESWNLDKANKKTITKLAMAGLVTFTEHQDHLKVSPNKSYEDKRWTLIQRRST